MASKVPIEVKMISWFAQAPKDDATRQFQLIRALMNDRGLLRKGAKAAHTAGKAAKAALAPVEVANAS